MGDLERGVTDFAGLLAENSPEQALFRGQLGLALRSDLSDQIVPRPDFGTHTDDSISVEVG